jgi:PKD repeat protein
MKKLINLALALSLILFSCERSPEAQFSTDTIEPEVGQAVYFNNESRNAVDFEWDFGDGFISDEANPSHYFAANGTFDVILTAWSKNGQTDQSTMTITVQIPTLLEIEVLEYYDEYTVPDASVRLYPTLTDWEDETNMDAEGYTDGDGIVVFSHLGPWVYYVDVWEAHHDNYTLKQEPDGVALYIRTDEIIPHKINRFTAWVDYYADHGKGTASDRRTAVIRKLVRKVSDKPGSFTVTGTDGWQVLYDKSIKVK